MDLDHVIPHHPAGPATLSLLGHFLQMLDKLPVVSHSVVTLHSHLANSNSYTIVCCKSCNSCNNSNTRVLAALSTETRMAVVLFFWWQCSADDTPKLTTHEVRGWQHTIVYWQHKASSSTGEAGCGEIWASAESSCQGWILPQPQQKQTEPVMPEIINKQQCW